MSISSIHNDAARLNLGQLSPAEAAKEAQKNAQEPKLEGGKKLMADQVDISPEGKAASKALLSGLNGLTSRPPEAKNDEAKNDGEANAKGDEETKPSPAAQEPAAAPESAPDGDKEGGKDGGGGDGNGAPNPTEKKLKELKEEARELESEIAALKSQSAADEAAQKELEAKTAEKEQIETQIKALEGQMRL